MIEVEEMDINGQWSKQTYEAKSQQVTDGALLLFEGGKGRWHGRLVKALAAGYWRSFRPVDVEVSDEEGCTASKV